MLLIAYALPQNFRRETPIYLRLAAVAFGVRLIPFHLGLLCILPLATGLMARRRRLFGAALAVACIACGPDAWDAIPSHARSTVGPHLRLLCMNADCMNRDGASVLRGIEAEHPDIVIIAEYSYSHDKAVRPGLELSHPFRSVTMMDSGIAIYSRYPMHEMSHPPLGKLQRLDNCLRVELLVGGTRLVVYGLHLRRPGSLEDFAISRAELAALIESLRSERDPVILAGDLNFSERTPNAGALEAAGLHSAHAQAGGGGLAITRPWKPRWARWIPGVRIDHVFLSNRLICTSFAIGADVHSDHFPIVTELGFAPGATAASAAAATGDAKK
jgi:endonuclease/exonuclease/phosphatase (EEP) superfamily protein YafD